MGNISKEEAEEEDYLSWMHSSAKKLFLSFTFPSLLGSWGQSSGSAMIEWPRIRERKRETQQQTHFFKAGAWTLIFSSANRTRKYGAMNTRDAFMNPHFVFFGSTHAASERGLLCDRHEADPTDPKQLHCCTCSEVSFHTHLENT